MRKRFGVPRVLHAEGGSAQHLALPPGSRATPGAQYSHGSGQNPRFSSRGGRGRRSAWAKIDAGKMRA